MGLDQSLDQVSSIRHTGRSNGLETPWENIVP